MRDILDLLNTINEATGLSAGEITKYEERFATFIKKIQSRSPFTDAQGQAVIIDPREAKRFVELRNAGEFKGGLKARTTDGQEIALSNLRKTQEFGGQQVAAGEEGSTAGKETLVVKPSQIGIVDKNIPASDFYASIANNSTLASTEYGKGIIQLAEYIVSGEQVFLPEELQSNDKIRAAVVDYAGEYLGVLALLYRRTRFPKREQFEQWLGGSIDDLMLNFPSKANTNLADSFAIITNPGTNHTVNISSKGTGGGAAPALSGLKISNDLKRNPAFKDAVRFIELCQEIDKSGPSTITSAFKAIDFIYQINPNSLPKVWQKFLPFSSKFPNIVEMSIRSLKEQLPLPKQFQPLYADIKAKSTATDGGKLIYAIKKTVADAINNNDAIPEFGATVLQILEMNFIQQYTDYKAGELTFSTQWPAKLDGEISIENKSSASDPTSGGFSFKLGKTDDSVSSEPGETEVDAVDVGPAVAAAAADIVEPKRLEKPAAVGVGRKKR